MSYERTLALRPSIHTDVERRSALRIEEAFPALVRGRDRSGSRFTEEVTLDNLSAYGAYFHLSRTATVGNRMFIVIRFTLGVSIHEHVPGVAADGVVLRAEALADGRYGVAMIFMRHRFLFASQSE